MVPVKQALASKPMVEPILSDGLFSRMQHFYKGIKLGDKTVPASQKIDLESKHQGYHPHRQDNSSSIIH